MSDRETEERRPAAATGGSEEQDRYARAQERQGTKPSITRPELVAQIAGHLAVKFSPYAAVITAREIVDLAFGANEEELDEEAAQERSRSIWGGRGQLLRESDATRAARLQRSDKRIRDLRLMAGYREEKRDPIL